MTTFDHELLIFSMRVENCWPKLDKSFGEPSFDDDNLAYHYGKFNSANANAFRPPEVDVLSPVRGKVVEIYTPPLHTLSNYKLTL